MPGLLAWVLGTEISGCCSSAVWTLTTEQVSLWLRLSCLSPPSSGIPDLYHQPVWNVFQFPPCLKLSSCLVTVSLLHVPRFAYFRHFTCTCDITHVCPCVTGPFTEHDTLVSRYPVFIPFFCPSSTPFFGEHVFLSQAFALVPPSGCSGQFCCDSHVSVYFQFSQGYQEWILGVL